MLLKKLTKRLDVTESDEESTNEENGEEVDDEEHVSSDERRHSIKSSKDKRRRKPRFSEEDDAERRFRKFEAKMDLERLEKLLRRRDNHDERKLPRGRTAYFGFEEKSQEKIIDGADDETGEEIRSKLEEYKNRLRDYENRKRIESKSRGKISDPSDSERIETDKVAEALSLILKMENAMKSFERVNDQSPVDTLNPSDTYDVTSDLTKPGENRNPEDVFLDELLKSAKIKRTSVPSNIEVQLRTIYQMLAEERLRRQRNMTEAPVVEVVEHVEEPLQETEESLSRKRRETEKKFDDDPLGLRKEGLFRRRTKNDDVRDRRIDRKTRRKDKDDRKDGQPVIFDPRTAADSNENNFYGFHRREPLKGFPEGDMFFTTGTSSEEAAKDYDYVRDDDDAQDRERPRKIPRTNEKVGNQYDPDDTTWVEDENTQLNHVPHEFFENIKIAVPRVQDNLKEYSELWEGEALNESQNDHQDHFNDGDAKATIEKIVQQHRFDDHEDKRVKETTVKKLIGYYDSPRSHQEEEMDYFSPEKNDKSRTGVRNSARNGPGETRNKKPSLESMPARKRVKDSTPNEYGGFTNFDSMHLGRAPTSSSEDDPPDDVVYPVARPAPRTKRSTNDLETILDQEMIFQDDNNLKDCECRVIRGTRGIRRRSDRERGERPRRPSKEERCRDEDRAERRKHRHRDGSSRQGPVSRFDEDYMHTSRSKRQASSSSTAATPNDNFDYPSDESGSTDPKESGSEEMSREENEHIEDANEDTSQKAPDNINAEDKFQESVVAKIVDDVEKTKILAVGEENANLAVENAAEDAERGSILKRHNDAKEIRAEGSIDTERRNEDVEAASVGGLTGPEEPTDKSQKESEADQFFLDAETENFEKSSSTGAETGDPDAQSTALEVNESLQSVQTPSSEDNQSIADPRSNGSEAKIEDYSSTTISNTGEVLEEEIEATEQEDGEVSTTRTTDDILVDTEDNEKRADRLKLGVEESNTDVQKSESSTTSSNKKGIPKRLKITTDSPRLPRKAQKTKEAVKLADPVKAREARLVARSDALIALRKEHDARRAKKSLEATSKLLSSEHERLHSMQKKRAEQLEKINDKLRAMRAKMVQEYRSGTLDEVDKASSGEERKLKRREIIHMINDDDELRDIVDREKLEYLMLNKPINYEAAKKDYRGDKAALRKKYVPKMVEIVKPLHDVRERKVKPPIQPIMYSSDPKILAYGSSDESTSSAAIRKALLSKIDLNDRKVKRRSGKIYYSVVESLENPKIYQYPRWTDHESGEEESGELSETVDLEQTLSRASLRNKHDENEKLQKCNEDYKGPRKESQEETDKSPMNSKYSARLTRNIGNGKNKYMKKKHYMTMPDQNDKSNNDEYIVKKKCLKDSNYEPNSKYNKPKYARLSPETMEAQRDTLANSRKNLEDHHRKSDDNEEILQEVSSMNSQNPKKSNDQEELYSNDLKKNDDEQDNMEVIDDLDLDEALNLSNYELLMLVPVKNYKKTRSRRHIANELLRDQEDSASNEISVEMLLKKSGIESLHKEKMLGRATENGKDLSQSTNKSIDSNQTDEAKNSISETSTVMVVDSSDNMEPSIAGEWPTLGRYSVQEIVRSDPKTRNDKELQGDNGPLALFEEAIPRLESTVTDGLSNVRRISESFEQFIDGYNDRFNKKQLQFDEENLDSTGAATPEEDVQISSNIFSTAITNVKKFFDFLSGLINVFRFI